jgi:hypothetical protein
MGLAPDAVKSAWIKLAFVKAHGIEVPQDGWIKEAIQTQAKLGGDTRLLAQQSRPS